jgi:hypothetical protein
MEKQYGEFCATISNIEIMRGAQNASVADLYCWQQ